MKTTAYCRVTAVQKSKGHSASAKIAYIERTGRYKNKPGLVATGRGNLPEGFDNFHQFWQLADQHERANSVTAREFLIDLPDHVNMKDALQLAKAYAKQITKCPETERPLPYSWAVHANEDGHQRHMHLVMSERIIDGIEREPATFFKQQIKKTPENGGAPKLTNTASALKKRTERVKNYIQKVTNIVLEQAGLDMTVDFKRTVKEGKRPQVKLTPKQWSAMKSGDYQTGTSKKIDEFIAIDKHNRMIDQLREQQQILDEQIMQAEAEAEAQKQAQLKQADNTNKMRQALAAQQAQKQAETERVNREFAAIQAAYKQRNEAIRQQQEAQKEADAQALAEAELLAKQEAQAIADNAKLLKATEAQQTPTQTTTDKKRQEEIEQHTKLEIELKRELQELEELEKAENLNAWAKKGIDVKTEITKNNDLKL